MQFYWYFIHVNNYFLTIENLRIKLGFLDATGQPADGDGREHNQGKQAQGVLGNGGPRQHADVGADVPDYADLHADGRVHGGLEAAVASGARASRTTDGTRQRVVHGHGLPTDIRRRGRPVQGAQPDALGGPVAFFDGMRGRQRPLGRCRVVHNVQTADGPRGGALVQAHDRPLQALPRLMRLGHGRGKASVVSVARVRAAEGWLGRMANPIRATPSRFHSALTSPPDDKRASFHYTYFLLV